MNRPRRNADFPVGASRRLENRRHDPHGFMVPMHGIKVVVAFHKPQGAAGILPADRSGKSTAGKMPAAPWRRRPTRSSVSC